MVILTVGDERGLLAALSLDDKVRLLTGADNWRTCPLPAIGLRSMVVSDGPAGVRGITMDERNPAASLPCPSALGATWDPALVQALAAALGAEARSKGVDVLLAPTINVMRTPLGGRGFESFGEDPVLIARIAVAFVRGLHQAGAAAAVKHYVGNDSETGRWTYDARIAEHVLRELYLVPFEACVREADVDLVMTGYNKVNGITMTEHGPLLTRILKDEWGFDGVALSDWHAARSTVATAVAGLDLAMPGPNGPWGGKLVAAVRAGQVSEDAVDAKVLRILRLARRVGALVTTAADGAPGGRVPDGGAPNGRGSKGAGPRRPGTAAPVRRGGVHAAPQRPCSPHTRPALPLDLGTIRSVAVIGPNAVSPVTQGGGSATVPQVSVSTPAAALTEALAGLDPQTRVTVRPGCVTWNIVPEPPRSALRDPDTGEPGVRIEFRTEDGALAAAEHRSATHVHLVGRAARGHRPGRPRHHRAAHPLPGRLRRPARDRRGRGGPAGAHRERDRGGGRPHGRARRPGGGHGQAGRDQGDRLPGGGSRSGDRGSACGRTTGRRARWPSGWAWCPRRTTTRCSDQAVEAARAADAAVLVVGSGPATESEGFDRPGLALPGRQDELVRRVAAVNDRTIVVVNAGMPVLMPWADQVAAVGYAWLPGQEMGTALADVLLGQAEPGGRLPVTLPAAEADCPVLHSVPAEGRLEYREGLLVGYRGYDRAGTKPHFPFGHGLGYTTWAYESAVADAPVAAPDGDLGVTVVLRNTGLRTGREIVQAYLEPPTTDPGRPVRVLAAFASVTAAPGEHAEARLTVPARAFARYDEAAGTSGAWVRPSGEFTIRIGRSSADLPLHLRVKSF